MRGCQGGLPRAQSRGFIDPLSLISLGFLVVTILVGTIAVNKQNANYSIRSWARIITGRCPDGSFAPDGELEYCPKAKTPTKPAPAQLPAKEAADKNTPEEKTTCTPAVLNTAGTCPDGKTIRYVRRNSDCATTTDDCPAPAAPTTAQTQPLPAPVTPTAFCDQGNDLDCSARGLRCIPDTNGGYCSAPPTPIPTQTLTPAVTTQPAEESRFVAQQQAETSYYQTHPEQKPSPAPTVAPIIKCSSFGSCYLKTYTCEKEFGQLNCSSGSKCGVHCSAPTAAPVIIKSDYQKCLDLGNSPSECSGITQNIGKTITTPAGKTECDPAVNKPFCSGGNLKTCSASGTWGLTTCSNGCENTACKAKPNPLAALNELGPPSGLGAGAAIPLPLPQSAVTSEEGFQQYAGAVGAGLGTGLAIGSAALGGTALLPAGGLPVAALMAQNAIAGSSTLQTAAAVATLSQFPASIIACQDRKSVV